MRNILLRNILRRSQPEVCSTSLRQISRVSFRMRQIVLALWKILAQTQGDQIGRNFAYILGGCLLWDTFKKMTRVAHYWATFFTVQVLHYFDEKIFGPYFGRFFYKLFWSPCPNVTKIRRFCKTLCSDLELCSLYCSLTEPSFFKINYSLYDSLDRQALLIKCHPALYTYANFEIETLHWQHLC
jgi:hypothetical protein